MSKILCNCGNLIIDQSDNLAYKSSFIRDQNLDAISNRNNDISNFINAEKNNSRNAWLKNYFENGYSVDLDNEEIINDILLKYEIKFESKIYQCEKCGRILIQKGKTENFICFVPEDDSEWKNIFKGLSE